VLGTEIEFFGRHRNGMIRDGRLADGSADHPNRGGITLVLLSTLLGKSCAQSLVEDISGAERGGSLPHEPISRKHCGTTAQVSYLITKVLGVHDERPPTKLQSIQSLSRKNVSQKNERNDASAREL
jgi:hypothetical protein